MSDQGRISPNNINQISDEKKEKYNITCIVIQVILN